MTTKYKLTEDHGEHAKDTVVYSCRFSDYGCAGDDTRMTGIEHQSVTLKEDGDYPFFTVPVRILQKQENE